MDDKLATIKFFNALESEDEKGAKALCKGVLEELKILDNISGLNASAKPHMESIAQLTENVLRGEMKYARSKWKTAKAGFEGHLKKKLQKYKQKRAAATRTDYNYPLEPPIDEYDQPPNHYVNNYRQQDTYGDAGKTFDRQHALQEHADVPPVSRGEGKKPAMHRDKVSGKSLPDQQGSNGNSDGSGANITPAFISEEISVGGRKKPTIQGDEVHGIRVSQAIKKDDISDLSDINRPTKIAERFADLYDNEWVDSFHVLSENKEDEQLQESEIISILLEIVEQAYQFCFVEAEDQIRKIELAVAGILRGDARASLQSAKQNQRPRRLLLQYRKELAAESTERISKEFYEKHILRIFEKNSLAIPSYGGPIKTYSIKAIELTWMMCVEDPPIFMCPTRGKFNSSLYKPYTKTGTEADIFVWPALKLKKDGVVLLKGVVQYK